MKKVLSVILSVAMILSMVACLSFATSAETYTDSLKVEVVKEDDQNFVEVTYTAEQAFMVTLIKFAVTGVTEVIDSELVATLRPTVTEPDGFSAGASLINDGAEMRVLVTASTPQNLQTINKVVVKIPVTLAAEYTIKPTALQAATSGTGEGDMEDFVNPSFTDDANDDGEIAYNDQGEVAGVTVEESASHTHDYTVLKKDATHHWYACECGVEDTANKVAHTPEVYTDLGNGYHSIACKVCGFVTTESEAHDCEYTLKSTGTHVAVCKHCDYTADLACVDDDEDGKCDFCEEDMPVAGAVLDSNIKFYGRSVYVNDQLGITYQLTKSQLSSYARYEVVVEQTEYDASYNEMDAEPVVLADIQNVTKSHPYAIFKGIAMCGMGLNVSAYVKCYNSEGDFVAYSETITDVPADLLKATYYSAISDDDAQKEAKIIYNTAVTDLLNMGAEAQKYFAKSKPTSELASATLVNEGFSQAYATEKVEITDLESENVTTNSPSSPLDLTKNVFSTTCNLSAAPALSYMFQKKTGGIDLDKSKLVMEVSYDSLYNGGKHVTETVTGDMWLTSGKYTYYNFTKTALYDGNKVVSVTVYYDSVKVLDNTCSVESYLGTMLNSTQNGDLATAIAKFGISVRNHFAGS